MKQHFTTDYHSPHAYLPCPQHLQHHQTLTRSRRGYSVVPCRCCSEYLSSFEKIHLMWLHIHPYSPARRMIPVNTESCTSGDDKRMTLQHAVARKRLNVIHGGKPPLHFCSRHRDHQCSAGKKMESSQSLITQNERDAICRCHRRLLGKQCAHAA